MFVFPIQKFQFSQQIGIKLRILYQKIARITLVTPRVFLPFNEVEQNLIYTS